MPHYVAIVEDAGPEKAAGIWFPDLPGCFSAGDTIDDALRNAHEALALYAEAGGPGKPNAASSRIVVGVEDRPRSLAGCARSHGRRRRLAYRRSPRGRVRTATPPPGRHERAAQHFRRHRTKLPFTIPPYCVHHSARPRAKSLDLNQRDGKDFYSGIRGDHPFGVLIMRMATISSASLVAAALSLPFAGAAQANVAITIDKTTQQMSVSVDGTQRYTWPVSTGRPGYDTPNGNFKPNRMDADHFSQEWDNAPMPHAIFFDLHGHAIHGFFDVKHLGRAVSHGCVRLSPEHAATLFDLVKAEGMANTSVMVAGRTPGGDNGPVARSHLPENETAYSAQPAPVPPQYQQPYDRQPAGYGQQPYGQEPPQYGQQPSFPQQPPPVYYGQPAYGQRYYVQPGYGGQVYYAQPYYGAPVYRQW